MADRILLVDADATALRQAREAFQREGFDVMTEGDGHSALRTLQEEQPDGVVLDLLLPGRSGFALAEAARAPGEPPGRILLAVTDVFTSRHCRQDVQQRYGLADVLVKPVSPGDIVRAFQQALETRRAQPEASPPSRSGALRRARGAGGEGDRTQPDARRPPEWQEAVALPPVERTEPPRVHAEARAGTPPAQRGSELRAHAGSVERARTPLADPQVLLSGGIAGPAPPAVGGPNPPAALPPDLLAGDFVTTPFPSLLHQLYLRQANGAVYLRQERKKKVIYFVGGVPRQVKSNLLQECLGRILYREGLINETELDSSLARMRTQQRLQGEVLVEMGSISPRHLRTGLERQIERKLYEIFTWPYGAYRFNPSAGPPPVEVDLQGQICELIRTGMLRFCSAERVRAEIVALGQGRPIWSSDESLREQPMGLTPDEEAFFALLDGFRTAEELVRDGGLARDHAERLLLGLLYVRKAELSAAQPGA